DEYGHARREVVRHVILSPIASAAQRDRAVRCKLGDALVRIAEQAAQHLLRVLTEQRWHAVVAGRLAEAEGVREHRRHPGGGMRQAEDQSALAGFRGEQRLSRLAHGAAGNARGLASL